MYNTDIQVTLEPITHTYTDNYNNKYVSCSNLLERAKEPFDKLYWGIYKGLEAIGERPIPISPRSRQFKINNNIYNLNEVKKEFKVVPDLTKVIHSSWDEDTEIACNRGSITHDEIEYSINDLLKSLERMTYKEELTNDDYRNVDLLKTKYYKIYKHIYPYIKLGWRIYTEHIVFKYEWRLAGMIDLLLVKDNEFMIFDWKTNKDEMMFSAGYYKKEWVDDVKVKTDKFVQTFKKLQYPADYLEECKGSIYTMQLNVYAILFYYLTGKICKNLSLCHIRDNNPDDIKWYYIRILSKPTLKFIKYHVAKDGGQLVYKPKEQILNEYLNCIDYGNN